jgi:protein-S-isoprenylcysteine O-methyltransferase Ste14
MNKEVDVLSVVVASAVFACWWVFALLFLIRKKPPKATQLKRNRASLVGVALVGVGYALVWSIRRPIFTPLFDLGRFVDWLFAIVTILLSIGSVWLVLSGVRALGRQWNVTAQLVDDHRLVKNGVYAVVRHPIYAGMLGMMISTGLALSVPVWILIAGALASFGTHLRIRSEEALLREAFGEMYEEYAREVPALVPGIKEGKFKWGHVHN